MLSMRGKRLWVILITVGIFTGTVYFVIHFLSAPAVGTVVTREPSPPQTAADKTYTDEYASFSYNSRFSERPADQNNGSALTTYWFTGNAMSGGELSIQVYDLAGRAMTDDGSYKLRASKTDQYTQSRFKTPDGKDVVIFADTNGSYNKTAFITNGKRYATISLRGSGANNDPGLVSTMSGVLASWQWL